MQTEIPKENTGFDDRIEINKSSRYYLILKKYTLQSIVNSENWYKVTRLIVIIGENPLLALDS